MSEKIYGKLSLEQMRHVAQTVRDVSKLASEIENSFREHGQFKSREILGENFSWSHFYELPLHVHLNLATCILNFQSHFINAAETSDPEQTFIESMKNSDIDDELQSALEGPFESKDLIAAVISMIRTMKSIMVYQKPLSDLVEEVRQGIDKALFQAVSIDRSIVACPSIVDRISLAELQGDELFFCELSKAMQGPSKKIQVGLEPLRYMLCLLTETSLKQMNAENLKTLLVDHLNLYTNQPSAQKNLYELFLKTQKIYHPK